MQISNNTTEVIQELRTRFELNSFQFTIECAQKLGGDQNKALRHDIIFYLTMRNLSAAKCTVFEVENTLINYFKQYSLWN